ncbi:hypothetical protein J8273_6120 [Carpediemonas membranifera]|uniref:Uncharacterized protein n=1 Tax=Carpediemonas membranifera TaxID=201153 RepID=A0A8J6B036_9EUKA|nr:hypothetical protein J8273_6120 [Carpediemonas membranifera]|eukprot:KAG9391369.1 hypothetical protein J8273_6120 [Carpediemonas membranifera]
MKKDLKAQFMATMKLNEGERVTGEHKKTLKQVLGGDTFTHLYDGEVESARIRVKKSIREARMKTNARLECELAKEEDEDIRDCTRVQMMKLADEEDRKELEKEMEYTRESKYDVVWERVYDEICGTRRVRARRDNAPCPGEDHADHVLQRYLWADQIDTQALTGEKTLTTRLPAEARVVRRVTASLISAQKTEIQSLKEQVERLTKQVTDERRDHFLECRRIHHEHDVGYLASCDVSFAASPIPPQSGTLSRTSCPRRDTDEAQAAMSVKRKAITTEPEKARPEDSEEESEEEEEPVEEVESEEEEEPVEEVESEEEEEPVADELMEELHFGDLEGGNSGDDEDVCSASAQATAPNDLADPIDLNFTPEMKDIIAQHSPAKSKSEEEQEEEKAESDEEGGAEEEGETEESGRVVNARSDPTRYNRTVAFDMIITTRLPSSGWPTYPTLGYGNCIIHCLMMMSGLRTFTAFRRKLPLSQKLKAEDEATAYRQTLLAHARTMAVFSKMTEIELLDELFPGHVNSDGTVTRWACVEAIRVWTSMTGKPTMLVNIDEKMITHIYRNEKGNALTVRRPFDGDQSRALESFRAECARLDINYVIQLMGRHATLRKVSKPTQVKIRRRKN